MDIERTPTSRLTDENSTDSRLSSLGRRHTPTARMSERKRNLFEKRQTSLGLIVDDDVDLGPMSPLQYSSSPTEDSTAHGVPFDRNTRQTDFKNLFPSGAAVNPVSPVASLNSPMFSGEKPVLTVEESGSTIVSVQSIGNIPQPQLISTTTELTKTGESAESSEKHHRMAQEKTPSERMINCSELRVSFKKSLILGDLVTPTDEDQRLLKNQKRSYSASVLTEKNLAHSTSPKEKMPKLDSIDASRARTSLTFEGLSISTKKFYNHSTTTNDENKEPLLSRKRYSLPLPQREKAGRRSANAQRSTPKNLGVSRKGCSHNIKKPVRVQSKEMLKKKVELAVLEDQREREKEAPRETIDESQTNRIHEILKNIKNPMEMSRPLFFHEPKTGDDRFCVSDEEEAAAAEEEEERSKRKFFKSGSKQAKSYKLTENVVAKVEGGRLTLPKFASATGTSTSASSQWDKSCAGDFSMVDEEFGSEFEEVTGIISKLTNDDEMDEFRSRLPYETKDPNVMEQQRKMLELLIANQLCNEENFRICIAEPNEHPEEVQKIMALVKVKEEKQTESPVAVKREKPPGLFPIFYQNREQVMNKKKVVALGEDKTSPTARKVWKKIGDTQLQIDAGQKRFGATYCAECDLLYSVHEPEDELMHERFHSALSVLEFNGWRQETVVREVPRWGVSGRVIAVPWNEHRAKILRVNSVLEVMDREMGCPRVEWRSKTIVYLAVAQNTILGVCVAEAKYEANRLVTESGVDYFSEEVYPVWCGVSRIWVAAPYRNQGVATELVNAVRTHFTIGRTLGVEELAFQSPTEAGKLLAQKVTQRRDFLVYP